MGKHAVVVGSSMAGLLAARVLSDHFEAVTLIERDGLPDASTVRKAVPQGAHAHGLLARGLEVLRELFPDLQAALVAGGASVGDIGTALRFYQFGTWKLEVPLGIDGLFMSRPFLEWHVRERVRAIPNVKLVAGKVTGLIASDDGAALRGVWMGDARVDAELVVDASGRASQVPAGFRAIGFPAPSVEEVRVDVGYATRLFRRPKGDERALIVVPEPPKEKRFAAIFPIEGDRWICTLGGWLRDHPPQDEAGWLAFARSLPVPEPHDLIRGAEPLTDIGTFKFPSSQRRRWESLARRPEGFVAVGDSVCSFNPVYGQGMTVSALDAIALRDELARGMSPGFGARVQKRIAKVVDVPWMMVTGEDFRWPETEGKRGLETNLVNAYMGKVHRLGGTDPEVVKAFIRVMHLLAPPPSMFHPRMMLRVLSQKPRTRAPAHVTAPAE